MIGVGLIVQSRRIRGEGIGRGLVAERATVRAEGIIDAGRREGASLAEGIGGGIGAKGFALRLPKSSA